MHYRRRTKTLSGKLLLFVIAALVLALLWVWRSTTAVALAHRLTRLQAQRHEIEQRNLRLLTEFERRRSLSYVGKRAEELVGMSCSGKGRVVLSDQVKPVQPPPRKLYAGLGTILEQMKNWLGNRR